MSDTPHAQLSTPAAHKTCDLVVPFCLDSAFDSLRYVIRAMEQNLEDLGKIWIIGDAPPWANSKINHIPFHHEPKLKNATLAKNRNICEKLLLAAMHPEISTEFVYAADDHYLLMPWCAEKFTKQIIVREDMNTAPKHYLTANRRKNESLNDWQRALWSTFDSVKSEGYHGWNFETHTPKLIHQQRLIETFACFGIGHGKLIWQTAYGNMHWHVKDPVYSEQSIIKAGVYKPCTPSQIKTKLDQSVFFNHDDKGLNDALIVAIKKRFPEKSSYEQ